MWVEMAEDVENTKQVVLPARSDPHCPFRIEYSRNLSVRLLQRKTDDFVYDRQLLFRRQFRPLRLKTSG